MIITVKDIIYLLLKSKCLNVGDKIRINILMNNSSFPIYYIIDKNNFKSTNLNSLIDSTIDVDSVTYDVLNLPYIDTKVNIWDSRNHLIDSMHLDIDNKRLIKKEYKNNDKLPKLYPNSYTLSLWKKENWRYEFTIHTIGLPISYTKSVLYKEELLTHNAYKTLMREYSTVISVFNYKRCMDTFGDEEKLRDELTKVCGTKISIIKVDYGSEIVSKKIKTNSVTTYILHREPDFKYKM